VQVKRKERQRRKEGGTQLVSDARPYQIRKPDSWRALPSNNRSVARLTKRAGEDAGLDPASYASHSLATQAFLNRAAEVSIMRQTRHKSLNTQRKYFCDRCCFATIRQPNWGSDRSGPKRPALPE
jgi:hypothetical protein